MIHRLITAVATAAVGAALFLATTTGFWALRPALSIRFSSDRGPERSVFRGFGPFGHGRAWTTSGMSSLILEGLDRSRGLTLVLRVAGDRPQPPRLVVAADGVTIGSRQLTADVSEWTLHVPARSRSGLRLDFTVSDLYRPDNGSDALGAQFEAITVAPDRWWWPPVPALRVAAESGALLGASFALAEMPPVASVLALLAAALAAAVLNHIGIAGIFRWTNPAMLAALAGLAGAAVLTLAEVFEPATRRAVAQAFVVSCAVLWLNLLFWLHPEMPVGDIGFHMHRFATVAAGQYLFTSQGPGGSFPYPVAFYVVANWFKAPGVVWQSGDPLRILAAVTDALAGFVLACAVLRVWRGTAAAILTVVAYHAVPAQFQVQAIAYLTNAFGHSMSVLALAPLVAMPLAVALPIALAGATVAFLSHTGTLITLSAILTCGVLFEWIGRTPVRRRRAAGALAVLAMALTVSIAVYYVHFGDVYREFLARPHIVPSTLPIQRAEAQQTMWVPGWRALGRRLLAVPGYVQKYWGWPFVTLATAGVWIRRHQDDPLTRWLRAWLVACAMLFVMGQLTPVDVRYYLAAAPALAVFASGALVEGWSNARWKWPSVAVGVLGLAQAIAYRFAWFTSVPR